MNVHDYPQYNSHEGSITALLDEMPPEDFEIDYGDATEFSITSFLMSAALFGIIVLIMFKFL